MTPQTFTAGETKALTTNSCTKTGSTFSGWATSSTGTKAYNDGGSYTMSSSSNVTLYAVWTPVIAQAPDLTAGAVTPTTATVGVSTEFSSTITNIGNVSTGDPFPYFFQIANDSNFTSGLINKTSSSTTSALGAGLSNNNKNSSKCGASCIIANISRKRLMITCESGLSMGVCK